MADGIDSVELIDPQERPMKPGAMDATPEQSNAYRALLESKGIKPPTKYKTPDEIEQRRRMNDWAEEHSKTAQPVEAKPITISKTPSLEPVEQSA